MQASRLWEAVVTSSAPGQGGDQYFNRSFSSGRVAFSVPSNYFDSLANRALVESRTMESLTGELLKIEEYYAQQLKDGKRGSEINERVRAAMVQKINELKTTNSFK